MASLLVFTSLEFINMKNSPQFDEGCNARNFLSEIEKIVQRKVVYLNCHLVRLWKETIETFCEYQWIAIFIGSIGDILSVSPFSSSDDFSIVSEIYDYDFENSCLTKFSTSLSRTLAHSYVDYFPPREDPYFDTMILDSVTTRSILDTDLAIFSNFLRFFNFRRRRSATQIHRWWRQRHLILSLLRELKESFLLPPLKDGPLFLRKGGPLYREAYQRFTDQ